MKRGAQTIAGLLSDFSRVDEAMETMEGAAGSADREMGIIRDSLEYRLNQLKQTWTGALQEMIERGDLNDVVDNLTKLSETAVKAVPNLKKLSVALGGVGGALAGIAVKKTFNRIVAGLTSLSAAGEQFKKLAEIKKQFKLLGNLSVVNTNDIVDVSNVAAYRAALTGLTTEQKAAAISAAGLNAEQARLVLTSKEGALANTAYSEAQANQILAQAGLITSTVALEEAQLKELATKASITTATNKEVLAALGLEVAEGKLATTSKIVNLTRLKELAGTEALTEAQYDQIVAILGVNAAEGTQITLTNVLAGAFAKLWAVISAHPFIAIAAAIGAIAVGITTYNKKLKEAREETAKNAISDWEQVQKDYKDNKKTIDELADSYVKLAKGVDSLGNNVSLSTDEFDEYHDITNQIADIAPDLVKGWDEQGNAILRVKDSVEALTEAYAKEKKEANNTLITTGNDVIQNTNDKLKDSQLDYLLLNKKSDYQSQLDSIQKLITEESFNFSDIIDKLGAGNPSFAYQNLKNIFETAGVTLVDIDWENTETGITQAQELIDNLSESDKAAVKGYLIEQEAILSDTLNTRKDLFKAYMGITLDSDEYKGLDDNLKSILNGIGDTLNNSTLQLLDSTTKIDDTVREIVSAFSNLSEVDQAKIEEYITLTTEWNNDELSYSEYIEKINALNDLINQLFPGDENEELRKSILVLFDVADAQDIENQIDVIANRQARVLKEQKDTGSGEYDERGFEKTSANVVNAAERYRNWLEAKKESGDFSKQEYDLLSNLSEEDILVTYDFQTTKEFDDWLDELVEVANTEIDITLSSKAVESLDELSDALGGLDEVYDTTVLNGAKASVDDLQSAIDSLGGVTFNFKDSELEDANPMSNAIEAYTDALTKNDIESGKAQEAVDKLVTAYIDQSDILKNLDEDNTDYYISVLKSKGVTNAEEVVMTRLGKAAKKTSTNLKALSKVVAQNRSVLEDGLEALQNGEETSAEFDKKIAAIKDELAALLLVDESDISDEFIKTYLEDVFLAIEGDIDAIRRLRVAAGKSINLEIGVDDEKVLTAWDNIATMIDELDGTEFEIDGYMDNSQIVNSLNQLWETGKYTIEEFEKLVKTYTGGSITADIEYESIPDIAMINQSGNTKGKVYTKETKIPKSISYKYNGKSTGAEVSGFEADTSNNAESLDSDEIDPENSYSESFDWIEKAISRLEEELDRLDEQVGNTYKNWGDRNEALLEEITKTGDEIKMQADASKKYEELANEVNIPETYKIKVQAGEMDVEEIDASDVTEELKEYYNNLLDQGIGDLEFQNKYRTNKLTDDDYAKMAGIDTDKVTDAIKKEYNELLSQGIGSEEMLAKYNTNTLTDDDYAEMLATYIQDYEDLYDKSVEATDKETELTKTVLDYHKQIFEDIQTQLDEIVDEIEGKADLINERMTRTEEMGYFTSTNYYDQLLALTQEENDARLNKIEQATQAMNEAVENGMEVYSEEWYEMYNNLLDMTKEYEEGITEEVKLQNEKRQQLWDRADWIEEQADKVYEEFSFLQEMLSGEKLYEDDGHITEYGKANMGLVSAEYEANREELARYQSQYEDLQKELEKAPGDKNLIERSNTLKENIQNITKSLLENKQAMKDVLQTVVDNYLSNLQKIIDKYKDSLSAAKD